MNGWCDKASSSWRMLILSQGLVGRRQAFPFQEGIDVLQCDEIVVDAVFYGQFYASANLSGGFWH